MAASPREYKIILLGEPGVGKTSFFLRVRDGRFAERESVTVTADVCDKTVRLEGDNTAIQVSRIDGKSMCTVVSESGWGCNNNDVHVLVRTRIMGCPLTVTVAAFRG